MQSGTLRGCRFAFGAAVNFQVPTMQPLPWRTGLPVVRTLLPVPRVRLPLLLAASLALLSCRKSDDPVPGAEAGLAAQENCGEPAPSGYRVLLRTQQQAVQLPGTVETFLLSKDNLVNSSGSDKLITSLIRQDDVINLRYCGVVNDGMTTDLGPARSAVNLQELPARRYQLRITVRDRHTTGTLDLSTVPAHLSIADTTVAAVWR